MPEAYTLLHRWFDEAWNQGKEHVIDELLAPDCIAHGLTDEHGNELRGIAHYKDFYRRLRKDMPDIKIEVLDHVSEGNRVAVRCLLTGTQASSGKPVRITGMAFTHWKNGKI